jgi:hypothetical protein
MLSHPHTCHTTSHLSHHLQVEKWFNEHGSVLIISSSKVGSSLYQTAEGIELHLEPLQRHTLFYPLMGTPIGLHLHNVCKTFFTGQGCTVAFLSLFVPLF